MKLNNKPKFVLVLLVAVFLMILGIALYAPAYVTSVSTQDSAGLTVTPLSYIHSNAAISSSSSIPPANYTGIFYVQHVCVYHE